MNSDGKDTSSSRGRSIYGASPTTKTTTTITILLTSFITLTSSLSTTSTTSTTSTNICDARNLGGTNLLVSSTCLGTMTFGVQNSPSDAFQQLDYALHSRGCNFIDTAELYPVPLTAKEWRAGATEEIVGDYLERIGPARRDDLVVATKVAGYFPKSPVAAARYDPPANNPPPDGRLDAKSVRDACRASLRRLKTDRIDLMQIHWPDRYLPVFGQLSFQRGMKREGDVPILETAAALRDLMEEGKIRYIGLSNESSLGVSEWVKACETLGIRDKLASIQNSYNLLDRRFDNELAETCDYHDLGLLPWSILAGGLLSGKYRDGRESQTSSNDRFVKYPEYMQRWSPKTATPATLSATEEYAKLAEEAGMTPTALAIAFVKSREFVSRNGSVILGATTMDQLKENFDLFDENNPVDIDESLLKAIDEIHMKCRDPCCAL